MRITASLAAAAILLVSSAKAQDVPVDPVTIAVDAPTAAHNVNITYANDNNIILATEYVPFNKCVASEAAFTKYSYLNFAPNNATINFYKDSSCQEFTFGLDGYYGGYPGQARSFKWVGWSMESLGEFFHIHPIPGQGDAATSPEDVPGTSPGAGTTTPPAPVGGSTDKEETTANKDGSTSSSSSSSTFFGGVVGSLVVLSIGGVIFWKTAGKKMVEDKGKGVLPYNRVGGRRDDDILLTTSNRGGHNSFEIGEEDEEEEEEEVDQRRQQRSGRQERYHDDDQS